VLLRLVPLVEAGVIAHLEGVERRPVAAGRSAANHAVTLAMGAAGRRGSSSTGDGPTDGVSGGNGTKGANHGESLPEAVGTRLPPTPTPEDDERRQPVRVPTGTSGREE
jgi:hypothetical protein